MFAGALMVRVGICSDIAHLIRIPLDYEGCMRLGLILRGQDFGFINNSRRKSP